MKKIKEMYLEEKNNCLIAIDEDDFIYNLDGEYSMSKRYHPGLKLRHNHGYYLLDPRKTEEASKANQSVFVPLRRPVRGIEVTIPELAAQCDWNIDPQHSDNNSDLAAIEVACTTTAATCKNCGNAIHPNINDGGRYKCTYCSYESIYTESLATIRPDLDSVGAMAVLTMRLNQIEFSEQTRERIKLVADSDKFVKGEWQAQPLPTTENPWNDKNASAESSHKLATIAAYVADHTKTLDDRVKTMIMWLVDGFEPATHRERVEIERQNLIHALQSGKIKYVKKDNVAVVETDHRAATMIGYSLAPIVIAKNPKFSFNGSEPIVKYTICQYKDGYVNLKAVFSELSEIETGWGGSPTIGGSPQGISSQLKINDIFEVVKKHLY